jgi:guanine nucleotide-binding protein G(i) subunit alpha
MQFNVSSPVLINYIKILTFIFSGSGESGKSTIAKQMKILYLSGLSTREELLSYRTHVFENIATCLKSLIEACHKFQLPLSQSNIDISLNFLANHASYAKLEIFLQGARNISALWNDPAIQKAFQRKDQFQLFDSAE